MRTAEVYALKCHACNGSVELLTNVDTYCPACLTWLDVQWRGVPVPPGSYGDVPGMNASAATSNCVPEDEETAPEPIHTDSTSDVSGSGQMLAQPVPVDTGIEQWTPAQHLNFYLLMTYQIATECSTEEAREVIARAFEHARGVYADLDLFIPEMELVSDTLHPNWSRIQPEHYLQILYMVVRSCQFTQPERDSARDRAVFAWLERAKPASDQAQ